VLIASREVENKMSSKKQPWSAAEATRLINEIAKNKQCDFARTKHSVERMSERGLIMSDLLFVLKNGFVYGEAKESTIKGLYKYEVEGQSPNSGSRILKVVAIPDYSSCQLKVVTIMWRDE
jgi:hypothetical protein